GALGAGNLPTLPAAVARAATRRAGRTSTRRAGRGGRLAGKLIGQIARPRIRDHDARPHDHRKRHQAPDADDVVPVEIAGLGGQTPAEDDHLLELCPGPRAWPPQVEATHHDEEEAEI